MPLITVPTHRPKQDTVQFWHDRFVALANKVYRQGIYYNHIAEQHRNKGQKFGWRNQEAAIKCNATAAQLEKSAADMAFIVDHALVDLNRSDVEAITHE